MLTAHRAQTQPSGKRCNGSLSPWFVSPLFSFPALLIALGAGVAAQVTGGFAFMMWPVLGQETFISNSCTFSLPRTSQVPEANPV